MILQQRKGGFVHWCPACEHLHTIPSTGWKFNGDFARPTFWPSVKHTGNKMVVKNGMWTGAWYLDAAGAPLDGTCHYVVTDGSIQFCPDSWHKRSDTVVMPAIPEHLAFAGE